MAFLNINKRCKNIAEFRAYLNTLPANNWAVGVTGHNTYIPNIIQWRGAASMASMQKTYEQKSPPWDRGPHCFVAVGAPNPNDDGIWVMTPPNFRGIHAGDCNPDRFGVELVGDFQLKLPTAPQIDMFTDVVTALCQYAKLDFDGDILNMHRDCMPGRTCPGNAFYSVKTDVISIVDDKMTADVWDLWGVAYTLPIEQRHFGIPTAWYANMTGAGRKLGRAMSYPCYSGNEVTQLFASGLIVNRDGQSRVIFYSEFRVP